jgi:hypothetical protein
LRPRGPGRAHPCPRACPYRSVTVTHHLDLGLLAAVRARSRASQGSIGPMPGISPGWSARSTSVASGMVRLIIAANAPGPVPSAAAFPGRESLPSNRSMKARARSSPVEPSAPAALSRLAQESIRWPAASTSAGGSSRPASAALPENSAHCCTSVLLAAFSRRLRAFSGATSITARAIAARSAPGVSRPARSSTFASAARASAGSRSWVAWDMTCALYREMTPSRNNAMVPGS